MLKLATGTVGQGLDMHQGLNPHPHRYDLSALYGWGASIMLLANVVAAQPSMAQLEPPNDLGWSAPDIVLSLLRTPVRSPQATEFTPDTESLTVPGLWWANEQFGDKMVVNWLIYRRAKEGNSQVRAIVRPDLWSRYSYLERYAFLKRFGATTSAAGYHLLVLDRQNYPLGAYTCEFPSTQLPAPLNPWLRRAPGAFKLRDAPGVACHVWISPVYGSALF